MAYFTAIQPTFLCCDIITRLREDINCLCCDTKLLVNMQSDYDGLIPKFESLLVEMDEKLKNLPSAKLENAHYAETVNEYKTSEFVNFVKLAWKSASHVLEKQCKAIRFMSSRGTSATTYLEKLMILTDFIQKYYFADFIHPECAMLFTHLCKQLKFLLAPELIRGDNLEGAMAYINAAIPSIINLFTVIDLFIYTPRYSDLTVLCREIIDGEIDPFQREENSEGSEALTSKYLSAMLTGELLGHEPLSDTTPLVEGRIRRFYEMATELAQYLVGISRPPKNANPQQSTFRPLVRTGCLDPAFYESLPPLVRKTVTQTRTTPTRGRGRPRRPSRVKETLITPAPYGFEVACNDLCPIRLPSLQLPFMPFDY